MNRTVALSLASAALLALGASDAQAAKNQAQKSCPNPIFLLGGDTAVIRPLEIGTPEDLRQALEKEKFQKALQETLDLDGLGAHFNALKEKLKAAQDSDLQDVTVGTQLEWMSFRGARDKKIHLGRHSCWSGKESFQAWFVNLNVNGVLRTFILPKDCFNLALLVEKPPTCTVTAAATCGAEGLPAQATLTVDPQTPLEAELTSVSLTGKSPNGDMLTFDPAARTSAPYQWSGIALKESGTYTFDAKVSAKNGRSSTCTTTVPVCEKPCLAPSCDLTVKEQWQAEGPTRSLAIGFTYQAGAKTTLCVTRPGEGTCENLTCDSGRCTVPAEGLGLYSVKLVTTLSEPASCGSRTATCTSTVELRKSPPPPPEEPVTPTCCTSPWSLRAWGGYAEGQGSEDSGLFRLFPDEIGTFKFDFNQGPAFGIEAERRLGKAAASGPPGSGWGWTLGLLYLDLDTVWVFDSSRSWLMDNDRVPVLALTTGPSYHWQVKNWDLHAGPRLGFARFDQGSYTDGSNLMGTFHEDFDDALAFGASVGADTYFGEKSCWGLSLGLDYLKLEASGDRLEVDVDPLVVKAGFVYRF